MKKTLHAWFESSKGPEDIQGVRLAYVQHCVDFYEQRLKDEFNDGRINSLIAAREKKLASGSPYFYPQLNWYMSRESYERGDSGWAGQTREWVENNDEFDIVIHNEKLEAIEAFESSK
jgi:hypothetical protein